MGRWQDGWRFHVGIASGAESGAGADEGVCRCPAPYVLPPSRLRSQPKRGPCTRRRGMTRFRTIKCGAVWSARHAHMHNSHPANTQAFPNAALLESSIDWTRKVHEHQSSSPARKRRSRRRSDGGVQSTNSVALVSRSERNSTPPPTPGERRGGGGWECDLRTGAELSCVYTPRLELQRRSSMRGRRCGIVGQHSTASQPTSCSENDR
ncbi:hypothetical protein L1887_55314 [Cichorium endivia]|nr:hypothetical protein L1887_55314 [Cichorium endivia]